MNSSYKRVKSFGFIKSCLVVLLIINGSSGSFAAKDEPSDENKITVTGYHLKRLDAEGPVPVVSFDKEDLESQGILNVEDFIRSLNYNTDYQDSTQNSLGPQVGAAGINLRGIGLDSTLVLVNGSRIADYRGLDFVDVSTIPWAAIERIEIVKDGASGIYGADALAGVVNFILRKDFDGVEVSLSLFDTADGGAEEQQLDWVFGTRFGATSLTSVISLKKEQPLFKSERYQNSSADQSFRGGLDATSFASSPPNLLDPATGEIFPSDVCPEELLQNGFLGLACSYDFAADIHQKPKQDQVGINLFLRHDFSNDLSTFIDYGYTNKDQFMQSSASPAFGLFAPSFHPDNPYGDILIFYRVLDAGSRAYNQDIDAERLVFGLDGKISDWNWELKINRSEVDSYTRGSNEVNFDNLQAAIFGAGGPNGDQFYNPFGINPINSPEVLAQISENTFESIVTDTTTYSFITSSDLYELSSGMITMALGVEYRDESIEQEFSENILSNSIAGGGTPVTVNASRDMSSLFAEFDIPLMASLEAQVALRYEDYQDFGSELSSKLALRWQISNDLIGRVSRSETFNAPNFDELYSPSQQLNLFLEDPIRCELTGLAEACQNNITLITRSGNANLKAEDGESLFLGLVWEPEILDGFMANLDYWSFSHNNRIEFVGADFIIENFALDERFVQRGEPVQAGDPGPVLNVNQTFLNLDRLETTGLDLKLMYRWNTSFGDWLVSWDMSHISEYKIVDEQVSTRLTNNYEGTADFIPLPENRTRLQLGWHHDAQSLNLVLSTIDDFKDSSNKLIPGTNFPGDEPHYVASWTMLDVNYQVKFGADAPLSVQFGCRNCTDEEPPFAVSQEGGIFGGVHDIRGLSYYVNLVMKY